MGNFKGIRVEAKVSNGVLHLDIYGLPLSKDKKIAKPNSREWWASREKVGCDNPCAGITHCLYCRWRQFNVNAGSQDKKVFSRFQKALRRELKRERKS